MLSRSPCREHPERPPGELGGLQVARLEMELGLPRFEIVGGGIRVEVDVTPQERAGAAIDNLDFG